MWHGQHRRPWARDAMGHSAMGTGDNASDDEMSSRFCFLPCDAFSIADDRSRLALGVRGFFCSFTIVQVEVIER